MVNIEIGRYKVYYNEEEKTFDIYEVTGRLVKQCNSITSAKNIMIELNNDDEIFEETRKLNRIREPERTPANSSSRLNTPIARAVRELLGKEQQNDR